MATPQSPQTRLWTREEYHRAADCGVFRPDERLELLEGELIYKMSPQSNPHAAGVGLSAEILRDAFGKGFSIREEKPIVLSHRSEPEPDIVLVAGSARQNPRHPTPQNALLVMEISESTLAFDQNQKAAAYARSGVKDYWILNLRQRRLEVRRNPGLIGTDEYGYHSLLLYTEDQSASPLAPPHLSISVADLLPSLPPSTE